MFQRFGLLTALIVVMTALAPAAAAQETDPQAIVPQDGQWVGTTSQGKEISFTVANSGSVIAQVGISGALQCAQGAGEVNLGVSWGPNDPIDEGQLRLTIGLNPDGAISAGTSIAIGIAGMFTSTTDAQGGAGMADPRFLGQGLKTVPCVAPGITWSAEWVSEATTLDAPQAGARTLYYDDTVVTVIEEPASGFDGGNSQSAPSGVMPDDGQWAGTTSRGYDISFAVKDLGTTLAAGGYGIDSNCLTGRGPGIRASFSQDVPIVDGNFVVFKDISPGEGIKPASSFAVVMTGNFTSETTAQGRLMSFVATFLGVGLLTQPCWDLSATWDGEWMSAE